MITELIFLQETRFGETGTHESCAMEPGTHGHIFIFPVCAEHSLVGRLCQEMERRLGDDVAWPSGIRRIRGSPVRGIVPLAGGIPVGHRVVVEETPVETDADVMLRDTQDSICESG